MKMKTNIVIVALAILMVRCGPGISTGDDVPSSPPAGPVGPQGPKGEPAPTPTVTVTPAPSPTPLSLEGYYQLPNGGYIDIYDDAQGMYVVRTARLTFTNKDGSTGTLPIASVVATADYKGKLFYNSNQTYVAITHNMQQDSNNADIVGSYLTELSVYKDDKGLLKVKVVISSPTAVLYDGSLSE